MMKQDYSSPDKPYKTILALRSLGILFLLFIFSRAGAQNFPPPIEWQESLGGSSGDKAKCIQQTNDGGFIVASETTSNDGDVSGFHGNYDVWIAKLDSSGNIEWEKCLGGSNADHAYAIEQTIEGGFILAGSSYSNDGDVSGNHDASTQDYWVVKLDSVGNIKWQKCLGGSTEDWATCIQQTIDGGYIVAGMGGSNDGDVSGNHGAGDYWVVKLDTMGNLLWQKCIGGSGSDYANSIQQTTDGGFIVAGNSYSNDGDVSGHYGSTSYSDYWIVKLDSSGNIEWNQDLGGSDDDRAFSIQQTIEGRFIVAGYSLSHDGDVSGNHGDGDVWIVKLTAGGNLIWQQCLGGSSFDEAYSIRQTTYNLYIVAGRTYSDDGDVSGNHGEYDFWIAMLDYFGDIKWQKCLGGNDWDEAYSVEQTADGGFIVAGDSYSDNEDVSGNHGSNDCWVVKLFSCSDSVIFYMDSDSDGYGNMNLSEVALACSPSAGYVSLNNDCDDNNTAINPGTTELCNGIDDNCNGNIDEGVQQIFYADADSDSYGNAQ